MRGIIISFILLFIIVLGFFYWHENHTIVEVEFEKMRPTQKNRVKLQAGFALRHI